MKFISNDKLVLGKSDEDTKQNLDYLFRYIYYQFILDHDKMKPLYKDVKVPVTYDDEDDYDYDCFCEDYDHAKYRDNLRFLSNSKLDDKYIYRFDRGLRDRAYDNSEFINQLHKYLSENSPKKLKLRKITSLSLSNKDGVNDDARGVRFLDWKLHFWSTYDIAKENCISFHDLIIAAYKVKSHKFENNYEMYYAIDNLKFGDEFLSLGLKFDHGS